MSVLWFFCAQMGLNVAVYLDRNSFGPPGLYDAYNLNLADCAKDVSL